MFCGWGAQNADAVAADDPSTAPSWSRQADLLHELLRVLYEVIKEIKSDALVITHTPDPGFNDVTDMLRLNDALMLDQPGGALEPVRFQPGPGARRDDGVPRQRGRQRQPAHSDRH